MDEFESGGGFEASEISRVLFQIGTSEWESERYWRACSEFLTNW
jgi:hypothetical protein